MTERTLDKPLALTNGGELEIVFIGVGGAFSRNLYNTNLLVIKGNDHVMIDFGMTAPHALREVTGLELHDIEYLLPTHSHCDHVGGIEALALWNRYVAIPVHKKNKLNMIISERYEHILWEQTLRGGMEWNEINTEGTTLTFHDYVTVIRPTLKTTDPREIWEVSVGGIHLELFQTNHIPEQAVDANHAFLTYGLFIDNRVFYSGDTKFDRELIDYYEPRAEMLFHDTSFFPNPVHAGLTELRTLPDEVKRRMYLVHYGDAWQDHAVDDFAGYARQGARYIFE